MSDNTELDDILLNIKILEKYLEKKRGFLKHIDLPMKFKKFIVHTTDRLDQLSQFIKDIDTSSVERAKHDLISINNQIVDMTEPFKDATKALQNINNDVTGGKREGFDIKDLNPAKLIKKAFEPIENIFKSLLEKFKSVVEEIKKLPQKIGEQIGKITNTIKNTFDSLFDSIKKTGKNVIDKIKEGGEKAINVFKEAGGKIAEVAKNLKLGDIFNKVKSNVKQGFEWIKEFMKAAFNFVTKTLPELMKKLYNFVIQMYYGLKQAWVSALVLPPLMFMAVKLVMLNLTGMNVLPELHLFGGIMVGMLFIISTTPNVSVKLMEGIIGNGLMKLAFGVSNDSDLVKDWRKIKQMDVKTVEMTTYMKNYKNFFNSLTVHVAKNSVRIFGGAIALMLIRFLTIDVGFILLQSLFT